MASASNLLSEDNFLCSICLDVFNHPVTISCGHNFCKTCITQHWSYNEWRCPLCKERFNVRPKLNVNTFISEMATQFKEFAKVTDQQRTKPGDVPCDVCTRTNLKAVTSCLECVMSYCKIHLEPHQRVKSLKRHRLINPVENLEDRMCKKHGKPLEMFCKTEGVCVCLFCSESDHRSHNLVPLNEECEEKKAQLARNLLDVEEMIRERRLKIQHIQQSVKLSKDDADREITDCVTAFNIFKSCIDRGQTDLISAIQGKQNATQRQAQGFIKELEQEIVKLKKRSSDLAQMLDTKDDLKFLQSSPSLHTHPNTKEWSEPQVEWPSFTGDVVRALDQLNENLRQEIKHFSDIAKLKQMKQDAVDVTLDFDTAHCRLAVSQDGKQVYDDGVKKKLPDNPERFSTCFGILGKQSYSSGRFYYEVEVKGKTHWSLGVVTKSVKRKRTITTFPKDGFWSLGFINEDSYMGLIEPFVHLPLKVKPQKMGVFVDYKEGLVSFYEVETQVQIYSFTQCIFTEPLYPFLSPYSNEGGDNSAPLIITPVNKAH